MTRPQYEPVPRGYVRVWVVTEVGMDPETFKRRGDAESWARMCPGNAAVTPLDVPAGAIPGLGGVK